MTTVEKQPQMSQRELLGLGVNDLAYIRHVVLEEGEGFMIYAADGTPIGVAPERDLAFAAARQHGLEPQSIH